MSLTNRRLETVTLPTVDPTLATEGFNLEGLRAFRVILSAAAGQTLSGAGTAECWLYSVYLARWMKAQSALDFAANRAGVRDYPSAEYETPVGFGRVYFKDKTGDTVTKSGGTVSLTFEGAAR
jgi:hypothetical protein